MTDHDTSVADLRAQAPPCTKCGRREAVADGLCEECSDTAGDAAADNGR